VQSYPGRVCGIDVDEQRQAEHLKAGRRVLLGDGEDIDFWSKLELNTVSLIMLSVPNVSEMQFMIEQMRGSGFGGRIVCIARYEDERQLLLKVGADAVFSYYSEVGVGFADEGQRLLASG
jgi:Trk K+ transport system NAD-binding subunit